MAFFYGISETLGKEIPTELLGQIDVCVFRVPETISAGKPEAYEPEQIGLGPYHHFLPQRLYKMEWKKVAVAKRAVERTSDKILNSQHPLIHELKEHQLIIRAFYDSHLDFDGCTLAWVVAIDALFLLDHLNTTYNDDDDDDDAADDDDDATNILVDFQMRVVLARDIIMLENQIPLVLLKSIRNALRQPQPASTSYDFDQGIKKALQESAGLEPQSPPVLDEVLLYGMFLTFCQKHSPIKLTIHLPFWCYNHSSHLLHFMYNLIVQDRNFDPRRRVACVLGVECQAVSKMAWWYELVKFVTFIINFPWGEVLALFRKRDSPKNDDIQPEKIKIPSVSKLCNIAGVTFVSIDKGIREIEFDDEELKFYLPVINLNNDDSEVILRNLLAYEALSSNNTLIADYMDLMCGIIDTIEDVKLLKTSGIVQGYLNDDAIVDLFNGLSKSSCRKPDGNSYLRFTIYKVNHHFDTRPRVKVCRFVKKWAYNLWKLLVFLSTVFLTLKMIYKAYCDVYGCSSIHFLLKAAPE